MLLRNLARHRYASVFWLTLAVTAIARGTAFLPAYSIDDYGLVLEESPGPLNSMAMLSQGRFGQTFLVKLLYQLQLEPRYARILFVAFALVVSALLATLVIRYWNLRPSGWLPVAAASVISIHPFGTEVFTFRTALGTCMCALALLMFVLMPRRWSGARLLGAALVFAAALSIYQVVLHYAVMVALVGCAVGLARVVVAAGAVPPQRFRRVLGVLTWRRQVRSRSGVLLAVIGLGTAGYAAIGALVNRLLRVELDSRALLISPDQFGDRLREVVQVLKARFVEPDAFLNSTAKGLLWSLLAAALLGLLVRVARRPRWQPLAAALMVVVLLGTAMVWTLGVLLVVALFWPVARVMAHVGIFWAGVLVIAHYCSGALVRRGLALLAALVLLTFIGASNRVLHEQLRLNIRDAAKAGRIVDRLEERPNFTGREPVVVVGKDWRYPLTYRTQELNMNSSAFGAPWSQVWLLKEVSGYPFQDSPSAAAKAAAAEYCGRVAPWPGPEAVTVADGVGIVCLESD